MTRRRQPDSHYKRAKAQGFAARSVFKLAEMDKRYGLVKPGHKVLDLGCHPGSWLQYAGGKVGKKGSVIGVDLQPPTVELMPWVEFVQADVLALTPEMFEGSAPFDLVLSDVAPRTTGVAHGDALASLELTEAAVDLALATLKPGGSLLAKVYFGPGVDDLIRRVKRAFKLGKGHKPGASRAASREIYILGRGLKNPSGKRNK